MHVQADVLHTLYSIWVMLCVWDYWVFWFCKHIQYHSFTPVGWYVTCICVLVTSTCLETVIWRLKRLSGEHRKLIITRPNLLPVWRTDIIRYRRFTYNYTLPFIIFGVSFLNTITFKKDTLHWLHFYNNLKRFFFFYFF